MISEQVCPTCVSIVNVRMKSMKVSLSRSAVSLQINMFMKMEYEPPHEKTHNLHMQKTKAQISFAVTAKLISSFVSLHGQYSPSSS